MKLSLNEATEIRRLYLSGDYTQNKLAKCFSVCQATISKIICNKIFRDENYQMKNISDSDIIELYEKYTVSEIAGILDCSLSKIYYVLQRKDIVQKKENFGANKLNKDKAEKIRKLYLYGKSIKDLAEEFNVTVATIGRILNNITYKEEEQFWLGGQGECQIGYIF